MEDNGKKFSINISNGLAITLTVVFIVLKLCHVIDWPWIWVLAPLWITVVVVAIIMIIFGIILLLNIRHVNRKNR